jgi:hypothetical protein
VEASSGKAASAEMPAAGELARIAAAEAGKFNKSQKYLRGLFSGGTLCYEAMLALEKAGLVIRSNIAKKKELLLSDVEKSEANTLLDMGDDYFTNGMPHPMIDPQLRVKRIAQEGKDPECALLLLDCVGGYGSHENPAAAIAPAIRDAIAAAKAQGRHLCVAASVCAAERDPQKLSAQRKTLEDAGALVMPCNAAASALAVKIMNAIA